MFSKVKNFSFFSVIKVILLLSFSLIGKGEVFPFQTKYTPTEESRLWFEGRSNVNEFECNATNYSGEALLPELQDSISFQNSTTTMLSLQIRIDVESIDCGKRKMNSDLRKALKADYFPQISFFFKDAEVIENADTPGEIIKANVIGDLTVAGSTREISFLANASYLDDQQIRATGQTTINMTDYDVTPPTALMGLIRADENLIVHFSLVAKEEK